MKAIIKNHAQIENDSPEAEHIYKLDDLYVTFEAKPIMFEHKRSLVVYIRDRNWMIQVAELNKTLSACRSDEMRTQKLVKKFHYQINLPLDMMMSDINLLQNILATSSQLQKEVKICKRLTVLTKVTKRILDDIDADGNLLDDLIQRRPKRFNPQATILETIDILQSREKTGTEIMLKLSEPVSLLGAA